MLSVLLLCSLLQVTVGQFHQTDYEVIHHRLELISYDHSYVRNAKADLVPFNRTIRALNISFDLRENLTQTPIQLTMQAYKMSMNAYRLFPLFLDMDYCRMRIDNTFGINDMTLHSNVPPCPVKRGHYYINNFRPDESKFPPGIITGDYKLAVKINYRSQLLAEAHWYGKVKNIEKLRE